MKLMVAFDVCRNIANTAVCAASPWSSNVVMVKKRDATMRFCVDYRRANELTLKDKFPLPKVRHVFRHIKWVTILQLVRYETRILANNHC